MSAIADVRRSRGRPQVRPDEETRHAIAEAARRAFMAGGYASTGMDAVARDAGISKKTLYRLVPTKAELFKASIHDLIDVFLLSVDVEALADLDVLVGLERLLASFGALTLSAQTIAISKAVIAESDRFPELAATFYSEAIQTTHAAMERFLSIHLSRGTLVLDDPHEAADMLRGMMILEPQRAAMLGQHGALTTAEIESRAKACARLFLCGCSSRRSSTPEDSRVPGPTRR